MQWPLSVATLPIGNAQVSLPCHICIYAVYMHSQRQLALPLSKLRGHLRGSVMPYQDPAVSRPSQAMLGGEETNGCAGRNLSAICTQKIFSARLHLDNSNGHFQLD